MADTLAVEAMVLHLTRDASGRIEGFTVDEGRVGGIVFKRIDAPAGG